MPPQGGGAQYPMHHIPEANERTPALQANGNAPVFPGFVSQARRDERHAEYYGGKENAPASQHAAVLTCPKLTCAWFIGVLGGYGVSLLCMFIMWISLKDKLAGNWIIAAIVTFLLFFGIIFLIVTCTTRVSKSNKTFVLIALVGLPICCISGSFCGHEMAYWRHQKDEIDKTKHVWPLQAPAGPLGAGMLDFEKGSYLDLSRVGRAPIYDDVVCAAPVLAKGPKPGSSSSANSTSSASTPLPPTPPSSSNSSSSNSSAVKPPKPPKSASTACVGVCYWAIDMNCCPEDKPPTCLGWDAKATANYVGWVLPRRGYPPSTGAIYNAAFRWKLPVENAGLAIRVGWGAKNELTAIVDYEAALYIFWLVPLIAPLIGLGLRNAVAPHESKWYFRSVVDTEVRHGPSKWIPDYVVRRTYQ